MLRYANNADQSRLEDDFDPDKEEEYYRNKEREVKWYDQVLLNRPLKVAITFLILAITVPVLVYHFVLSSTLDLPASDGYSTGSCVLPRTRRLPCGYGNISQQQCHPQCCYDEENDLCFHRLPSRFSYVVDRAWTPLLAFHPRVATEPFAFSPSVTSLHMVADEVSATHVAFEIYDSSSKASLVTGRNRTDKLYDYEVQTPELDLTVRVGDRVLLETDHGPLIAADNIWEITFRITNETMYGLEEIPLLPGTKKVIYGGRDSSSPIPLIFARSNGSFHALLFANESPTEIEVMQENHLIFRTIAVDSLKFHVFAGPTPKDVMRDVVEMSGGRPDFPYWMLGPHYCSENSNPIGEQYEDLTDFLISAMEQGLAVDSHCGVAPVVLDAHQDDDINALLQLGGQMVQRVGARFVPHLSPYFRYAKPEEENSNSTETSTEKSDEISSETTNEISSESEIVAETKYEPEIETNISDFVHFLIKDPYEEDDLYLGLVANSTVVYPDFSMPNSSDILKHFWPFDNVVSGIVLENNWPLDEAEKPLNETYLHLPYFTEAFIESFTHSLPWNASHANANLDRPQHIYHHNTYGEQFLEAVKDFAGDDNWLPLWSTSQWLNTKIPNNRQNVDASWANLRRELVIAALGGASGNWLRSTPVCGDTENFDPDLQIELCIKWYLMSTHLPLFKVHSKDVRRDPLAFEGINRQYMMQALNRRMSLLPYFNTILQNGPLLRPMFYQFPETESLHDLSSQFAVGDALLVVPNLLPNQLLLNVWLPPGVWYEMWSGLKLQAGENGIITMPTATADLFTLVRGGNIIALQEDARRTAEGTRLLSSFSFIVALDCSTTENPQIDSTQDEGRMCAEGELFFSEDMTFYFTADEESLTIRAVGEDWEFMCNPLQQIWASRTSSIKVYGLDEALNNYDTYRQHDVSVNLCSMQQAGQITIRFV